MIGSNPLTSVGSSIRQALFNILICGLLGWFYKTYLDKNKCMEYECNLCDNPPSEKEPVQTKIVQARIVETNDNKPIEETNNNKEPIVPAKLVSTPWHDTSQKYIINKKNISSEKSDFIESNTKIKENNLKLLDDTNNIINNYHNIANSYHNIATKTLGYPK